MQNAEKAVATERPAGKPGADEKSCSNGQVLTRLKELYLEAFAHDGFADIRVEMRILRRRQKEIILHCGKQYRFIVDYPAAS
jgi:hypothetical protein